MNETAADPEHAISDDQAAYARVLAPAKYVALIVLAVTFAIYILEIRPAHVPPGDLHRYWTMPSGEYLRSVDLQPGWGWAGKLGASDLTNNLGICLLASVSVLAYLRVIPIFARKRRWPLLAIAVAEVLVMLLAASGLIVAGR